MKLPNPKRIIATGALLLSLSVPAYGAQIKQDSWTTHSRGYSGINMFIREYEIEIEPGDNLTTIARKVEALRPSSRNECISHAPITWEDIYKQNKDQIENPNLIFPNQKLKYSFAERTPWGIEMLF